MASSDGEAEEKYSFTPAEETLHPHYEKHCEYDGCNASYKNAGQYNLHCLRSHGVPQSNEYRYFYCPVLNCKHNCNFANSNPFRKMSYLRQHYLKMHAPKNFNCDKCPKSFATEAQLLSHDCDKKIECFECKAPYSSEAALLTHARRKGHQANELQEPMKKRTKRPTTAEMSTQTAYGKVAIYKETVTQTTLDLESQGTQTDTEIPAEIPVANMCTQTTAGVWNDMNLATTSADNGLSLLDDFDAVQMSQLTQTCDTAVFNADDIDAFVSTETQTSFTQRLFDAATSTADIELDALCMSVWTQTNEPFLDSLEQWRN